jgi:ABC-type bacteriocin/lantibiotic exporter with double-glycine peptidase domain
MVLAAAGIEKSEEELRLATNCDAEGTWPHEIVKAAKSFGFEDARKYNIDFDELKTALTEGFYIIAYIKIQVGTTGYLQKHAVVVAQIDQGNILLLDPIRGEIEVSEADFLREWGATRRETILIK